MICPLCRGKQTNHYYRDTRREYFQCAECKLVFVPPHCFLSPAEEKKQYDLHQNHPTDQAYRAFLTRLYLPLVDRLPEHATGLDFGSGPGPTLSLMLQDAGYRMSVYDCFYARDEEVLRTQYDFITCTEVVEHLHKPALEFERLFEILKPGGWFGIMTKRTQSAEAFSAWHYKNDPTHVIFFADATFRWLAARYNCRIEFPAADVVLLQKST